MPITKAKARAMRHGSDMQIGFAISQGIRLLREARHCLRIAGSKKSADYAARALKSAEGAQRHAIRMKRDARGDAEKSQT